MIHKSKTQKGERWEIQLHKIRIGACGCKNCIPSQELIQFIADLLKDCAY